MSRFPLLDIPFCDPLHLRNEHFVIFDGLAPYNYSFVMIDLNHEMGANRHHEKVINHTKCTESVQQHDRLGLKPLFRLKLNRRVNSNHSESLKCCRDTISK